SFRSLLSLVIRRRGLSIRLYPVNNTEICLRTCLRIVDANLNRAGEGLRVAEDIVRFYLNDRKLQASFKALRHDLKRLNKAITARFHVILSRNSRGDVGRETTQGERFRKNFGDVLLANTGRVKESLRCLEEMTKLLDPAWAEGFKRMRFRLYDTEKKAYKKIQGLCKK
ncbi:MAG: hypothetical protein PHS37_05605, partial [Candidatus Omnitrophica bacterium]|nr:hypothetical protein [Candidatus Omnitrophota bacterium]